MTDTPWDCRNCPITFHPEAFATGCMYRDHAYDEYCCFDEKPQFHITKITTTLDIPLTEQIKMESSLEWQTWNSTNTEEE